jgi:hypothetical protein
MLLAALAQSRIVAVNANESTGLQTVDQALLPQAVPAEQRTAAFALYNVLASIAAALGALAIGLFPMIGSALGLTGANVYLPAFVLYALIGVACLGIQSRLDARAETGERVARTLAIDRSRGIVARLSILYGLDSFAGSFTVQSTSLTRRRVRRRPTVGSLFVRGQSAVRCVGPVAAYCRAVSADQHHGLHHIPSSLFLFGGALAELLIAALAAPRPGVDGRARAPVVHDGRGRAGGTNRGGRRDQPCPRYCARSRAGDRARCSCRWAGRGADRDRVSRSSTRRSSRCSGALRAGGAPARRIA